jgi:hypothetical protein
MSLSVRPPSSWVVRVSVTLYEILMSEVWRFCHGHAYRQTSRTGLTGLTCQTEPLRVYLGKQSTR